MQKTLPELKQLIVEAETKKEKLVLEKLPYDKKRLDPVMSEETLDYHYSTLARAYVDRYNAGEGDSNFNEAGAFLQNIYFTQINLQKGIINPFGDSA